ncbi:MAG TPA: histone deacetylase [Elusimicrobia bacterium]|jgi:acetoin utilization deacetylase AcuC-like enzyme|nr:histone deacetylase [Elusimicrobiota bacterium]
MAKFFYSEKYVVDLKGHVFPTLKYPEIKKKLIEKKLAKENDFVDPGFAADEDILLVHTKEYLEKIKTGKLTMQEMYQLELPYSPELRDASLICVQGTILAGYEALNSGVGIHIGGGFHHAFPNHGEGFCVFNDIAVCIAKLLKEKKISKAMTIDCDLHQGNGTAYIFKNEPRVFTFSIHQENNYPAVKPPSKLDVGVDDGCDDKTYLMHLKENIPGILDDFKPELIVYVAGADSYQDDQLGGLDLTKEGLKKRDEFVFQEAKIRKIPVAVVLAGGYAYQLEDTVEIQTNTIETGLRIVEG